LCLRSSEDPPGAYHPRAGNNGTDSGIRHGVYYNAMELIEGVPLDQYVKAGNLEQKRILELINDFMCANPAVTSDDRVLIFFAGHGQRRRVRSGMRKSDYRSKSYEKSEWRHAIELYGCARVSVLGLKVESSGGDGVYLGRGGPRTFNEHIVLRDLLLRDHHRQGISVISAENLLIENAVLKDTWGTAPQAGIDFEPNEASEKLVHIVMRDCVSENNRGDAYDLYVPALNAQSAEVSMRKEKGPTFRNF
jgi:hypothetical protein